MKKNFTLALFFLLTFPVFRTTAQMARVIPLAQAGTASTGSFVGPLANSERNNQLIIHANLLTELVNKRITGISWRLPSNATGSWPAGTTTFTQYDIYIGEGVPPANKSLASFPANTVGAETQVRTGALVIPAASYTSGGGPNSFGPSINFDAPYLYTGGHLMLRVFHSASDGTSRSTEAVNTSGAGYGTDFNACWASSNGVINNANFSVIQIHYEEPLAIQLLNFNVYTVNNNVRLDWRAFSTNRNEAFTVERSTNGQAFSPIHTIYTGVDVDTPIHFSFIDEMAGSINARTLYYRLKLVDILQNVTYSPTRQILLENLSNPMRTPPVLHPVPVQETAHLTIVSAEENEILGGVVYDMNGRVVRTYQWQLTEGVNELPLDLRSLPAGQYILSLQGKEETSQIRFVK